MASDLEIVIKRFQEQTKFSKLIMAGRGRGLMFQDRRDPLDMSSESEEDDDQSPIDWPKAVEYNPDDNYNTYRETVELELEHIKRTHGMYSPGEFGKETLFCYSDSSTPKFINKVASKLSQSVERFILNPQIQPKNLEKLKCATIAHRDSIRDFFIPADIFWDKIVPLDVKFLIQGTEWEAREIYKFNLINNSMYVRDKIATALLDGCTEVIIDFSESVLPSYWVLAVLTQQISWAQAIAINGPGLLIEQFLMFAHCFGFKELYVIFLMDFSLITDRGMLSCGIYAANVLLHWNDLALTLSKKAHQIHNLQYLETLKNLTPRRHSKKLRDAVRRYDHIMIKIHLNTTIIRVPDNPAFIPNCFDSLEFDPCLLISPVDQKVAQVLRSNKTPSENITLLGSTCLQTIEPRLDIQSWLMIYDIALRCNSVRYISSRDQSVLKSVTDSFTQTDHDESMPKITTTVCQAPDCTLREADLTGLNQAMGGMDIDESSEYDVHTGEKALVQEPPRPVELNSPDNLYSIIPDVGVKTAVPLFAPSEYQLRELPSTLAERRSANPSQPQPRMTRRLFVDQQREMSRTHSFRPSNPNEPNAYAYSCYKAGMRFPRPTGNQQQQQEYRFRPG